ncbi:1-phosphofructokinase family hexose kinase [Leadbettera azotonutricia]|uniref:Putative tagatose-6-phosphate kinase (Phosphotagatokinase) n=1 Tax=Leadbettera azotonutricia (strain ATCC BAA-888 / DSM 13862 / ZAS-9) TaxID=545695 RepID=F5Y8C9_LEAAZ|nr:PfkB family carbohydrate kinase [Leadbettera azotonutricia]AEF82841.1 putative tagatose-6-phosphate kinase (Phosphotagatokinase) [Leadbettera azotonutricia ZAS-9]
MKAPCFLTVSMNPTLQKTLVFSDLIPDRVNRTGEYRLDTAGKGIDVSRVLTQLGKDCTHLTQLGGMFRPLFLELCAEDNLKVEWVESSSPIRFCYTLINKAARQVTELVEEGDKVGEGTEKRLMAALDRLLDGRACMIISGTKAAGFSDALIPEMVRMAKAKGLRVVLDVRGKDLLNSLPHKPDVIKPNLYEFAATFAPDLVERNEIAGDPGFIKKRVAALCEELHARHGSKIVLTRGSSSVWYFESHELEEFTVVPVEALNTIGSGDAFTAGFSAALEDGASLKDAVAEGSRCGKLNAALLRPGVIC